MGEDLYKGLIRSSRRDKEINGENYFYGFKETNSRGNISKITLRGDF